MMNTSFQQSKNRTDEWYTPPEIIRALGEFDLDPCAPNEVFYTAKRCFTKEMDGLSCQWHGRVFCNPPYTHSLILPFLRKCAHIQPYGLGYVARGYFPNCGCFADNERTSKILSP